MGSNGNNVTISYPGEDWSILWPYDFSYVQLDIVGFLAILGEESILANAQVSALSRLFLLPRLLPAPQALLRVSRPETLPTEVAHVTATVSGNKKTHLNHIASILLGTSADELRKHSVRVVSVTKTQPEPPTRLDYVLRGTAKPTTVSDDGAIQKAIPVTVKGKAAGPLTWVTLLGFLLTLAIFLLSAIFGDGMSLLAVIALSLLSTICGVANKWQLSLAVKPKDASELKQDMVVIRYPEGSFLVVKCNDEVARELFFAPEEIDYTIKSSGIYRILALVGSIMLMLGVILLANARLELQLAWAGAYVILNAAHWAAAALPAKMHWDLSCYKVQEESIEGGPTSNSFTEALWKVILVTKRTRWIALNDAAPATNDWKEWATQARTAARMAPEPFKGQLIDALPGWKHTGNEGLVHPTLQKFDPKIAYNKLSRNEDDDEDVSAIEDCDAGFEREVDAVPGATEMQNGDAAKMQNGHVHDVDSRRSS